MEVIFVKVLSFAKNMGKNISKNLSGECSQKILDHAKQSATDAFKTTSKAAIQKLAEATSDLIGNRIADKIADMKVWKTSKQNNSETATNKNDKEIPKERYIYIYISRRNTENYWWSEINIIAQQWNAGIPDLLYILFLLYNL